MVELIPSEELLEGLTLDYIVARIIRLTKIRIAVPGYVIYDSLAEHAIVKPNVYNDARWHIFSPSRDWSQGGPIIEHYRIAFSRTGLAAAFLPDADARGSSAYSSGETYLVAAMRALVKATYGDKICFSDLETSQLNLPSH